MAVEVTLRLPEYLVEHAKTKRDAGQVLADTLEMMWAAMGMESDVKPDVSTLPDDEVLALAEIKMDPIQNDRLAELQVRGKTQGLTETAPTSHSPHTKHSAKALDRYSAGATITSCPSSGDGSRPPPAAQPACMCDSARTPIRCSVPELSLMASRYQRPCRA